VRTTITLDADVAALVQRYMNERGLTFKEAVNTVLRGSLAPSLEGPHPPLPVFDMGPPRVPLEHALRLAGELEDEEIARKLSVGR
jgi:hypothetical protein